MIGLVACGHAIGSTHHEDFPQIAPASNDVSRLLSFLWQVYNSFVQSLIIRAGQFPLIECPFDSQTPCMLEPSTMYLFTNLYDFPASTNT
jgi:hypothetical protein